MSFFRRLLTPKRKAEESLEAKEFESELQQEISEAFRIFLAAPLSTSAAAILRRRNVKILTSYPLIEPWAKAYIVEEVDTKKRMYLVDEIPLNDIERRVFAEIMDTLTWQMGYVSGPSEKLREEFMGRAKEVILKYRIRMGRTPGVTWSKILYYVERETLGFGPIDPLMRDPAIEDISCNGPGMPAYVWHREFEYIPTNVVFNDPEELNSFVMRLAHKAGKHISVAFPILDAILPGGHRLAATYSKEVSTKGSTFTIRKFREDPITIVDMIKWKTVSPELAAYLWIAIEHKMTGVILGVTGAGKTSTLNALATLLRPTVKVVTIEDTPELRLPLENWVQLVSRPSYGLGPEKIGEVTLFDLVKVALRYRPDVIIVGEVRGEEAYVLFQAMATGHGGITTLHAEHIDAAVKRLTSPPMNIPPSYIPLMNFALVIKRVQIGDRIQRRITNVWEVNGVDSYVEIASWNPKEDRHEVYFERSSILKDYALWKGRDESWLSEELEKRITILKALAAANRRHYREVANAVHRYYIDSESVYREAVEVLGNFRGE